MAFTQEELPPIFQKILKAIEDNGGTITTDEFRKLFYYLRINNSDINDIKKWLKQEGYIEVKHEFQKETVTLVKPTT